MLDKFQAPFGKEAWKSDENTSEICTANLPRRVPASFWASPHWMEALRISRAAEWGAVLLHHIFIWLFYILVLQKFSLRTMFYMLMWNYC